MGKRKLGRLDTAQRDKLVKGVLAGKDVRSAALDGGYSEATADTWQRGYLKPDSEAFREIDLWVGT